MTTLEILIAARALIDAPEKWCKGMDAIDANGNEVSSIGDRARAWCSFGALSRVGANYENSQEVWGILSNVAGDDFADWQDEPSRTHAEVLAAWDAAIAKAMAA